MEKEAILTSEQPNEAYDKWKDIGAEEHETVSNSNRTLEAHPVKREGDGPKEIADRLASNGFKEEAIKWDSYPDAWGSESGVYTVYCVKGDLALKYNVFSGTKDYIDLDETLNEKRKELERSEHPRFVDLPDTNSVEIFNDAKLREAEEGALSIEGQCEKTYENAPVAGEYKIVDFTNFSSKKSAECAERIIRKEKVIDAENKEDVKMIFLKPSGNQNSEGVPYMEIEVVQPDLGYYDKNSEQSHLPYGTSVDDVEHGGYGTGGIHNVPVTEKEALISGLRKNYEKESGAM